MRAVFVPLARLQQDLDQQGRVNALLVVGPAARRTAVRSDAALKQHVALEDFGLSLRDARGRSRRSRSRADAGLHRSRRAPPRSTQAAAAPASQPRPVLTYLANTIRSGDRQVPYSLVTAIDLAIGRARR